MKKVHLLRMDKIINELLAASNVELLQLYGTKDWRNENDQLIKAHTVKFNEITKAELERISFQQAPNLVLGVFKKPIFNKVNFAEKITLVLDGIQDPGNLGTIIRTADWFGIENIICSKDSADLFNPKVIQSTMGSIARINVMYEDLENFLHTNSSITVYATSLDGKNLFEMKKIKEGFILIGNESKGISEALLSLATQKITIPKIGDAESLNAAVAAGIVISQLSN